MSTRVRIHAITAKGATFDPAPDVTRLTQILAGTDLEFAYDPKVDLERAPFQDDSNDALIARASLYQGKIVVFFTDRAGGEGLSNCVRMPKDNNTPFLAHEIGHYLGLPHTFRHGVGTNTESTETPDGLGPLIRAIRTAIEARDDAHVTVVNPKTGEERPGRLKKPLPREVLAHGNEVIAKFMDGDNPPFSDTPASIHEITKAELANVNADRFVIPVPVTFSDGQKHTYQFEPDRTNVMTYFFGSRHLRGLSTQQANVIHGNVSGGHRRHLRGAPLRWSPWVEVEGDGRTDAAPAAAALGDRVFCFVKGNGGPRIFVNSAIVGKPFGGWSELDGDGETDAAPAAAALGDRVYCLVKGNRGPRIFINSAKIGEPFSGWHEVPGIETDSPPAVAALRGRLHVFAKEKNGNRIFRATAALI